MKNIVLGVALATSLSGCATMKNFGASVGEGFSQMKNSMFGSGHLIGAQISDDDYASFTVGQTSSEDIAKIATVEPYDADSSKAVYRTIKQKSFKNTLITYTFSFNNRVLSDKTVEEREATENDLFSIMGTKQS